MTKIMLQFSEENVAQPITSQIILELKVPLNILHANVTPRGGQILVEVHPSAVDLVTHAFKEKGVTVTIQKGIEVDEDRCIDCGACYSLCPVDAISLHVDFSLIFDEDKCISCGLCVDACPTFAIRI
jgi:NAD-dependent dihydropyrimidine dehydrogenase PreA subunit